MLRSARQPGLSAGRLFVASAVVLTLASTACGGSSDDAQSTTAASGVRIQIIAPADGSSIRADRVTVRGTVTPPDATVQILGQAAQVGNGVFNRSVPLHRGSNSIDVVASTSGAAPASMAITVKRPSAKPAKADRTSERPAPLLSAPTNCGGYLTAGARTSCPFAENVRAEYERSGSGTLEVYSPTTGLTYRMYCTAGTPHVCTGGNGASVYFSSGSAPFTYSTTSCGGELLVGPNTSCGFAENVAEGYFSNGPGWISVYSPTTGRTYDVYCTATSPHVCTGGNNAAVYFP